MVRPDPDPRPFARLIGRRCSALGPGLVVLALAGPGAAHPCSLDHLLLVPFERLLQMEVSSGRPLQTTRYGKRAVAASSSGRSTP